ncbi:MAG: hypothetical protein ACXQS5_00115 [Candidatus Methanospirareceae archaeon]
MAMSNTSVSGPDSTTAAYDFIITYTDEIDEKVMTGWTWDVPTLPTMYIPRPDANIIAPFITRMMFNRFFGHKFKLGGSKK